MAITWTKKGKHYNFLPFNLIEQFISKSIRFTPVALCNIALLQINTIYLSIIVEF